MKEGDIGNVQQILDSIKKVEFVSFEDWLKFVKQMAEAFAEAEQSMLAKEDLSEELRTFQFFANSPKTSDKNIEFIHRFLFRCWVAKSPNRFAVAYLKGKSDGAKELTDRNVKRAAQGRRLIGATSRAKVAAAADAYRHLSKGDAAYEMADVVHLDAGTIKRYLSELFPGTKWKR